ncbi:MAG: 30S ribosomal protein S6 [Verrucomicrobiota bacterium]
MKLYEALFILDIQGKEEGVVEMIDEIEAIVQSHGGSLKGTQKMDRKKFENVAGKLDSGYYLGVTFEIEPAKLNLLKQKFNLNDKIYRQFYLKSETKKQTATA